MTWQVREQLLQTREGRCLLYYQHLVPPFGDILPVSYKMPEIFNSWQSNIAVTARNEELCSPDHLRSSGWCPVGWVKATGRRAVAKRR